MKEVILTPEGYEKLKQEIEHLANDKRREVADRIRVAREFGDIAENAEYDDAKNEQALLEHRIAMLEERLRNARVIEKKEISKDVVSIGSKVKLRDVDAKRTVEYHIVGSAEAGFARLRSPARFFRNISVKSSRRARSARRTSRCFDFEDLELERTARRRDLDRIALLVPDDRPADR